MTHKENSTGKSLLRNQIPECSESSPHEQESQFFSEIPSIERTFLDRIRFLQERGNPGLLQKVIELYFEESPKLLQHLRDSSDRGEGNGIQQAAHALKSSSANLGASRMARICEEVEALARAEETSQTRPLIILLEQEYSRVRSALGEE